MAQTLPSGSGAGFGIRFNIRQLYKVAIHATILYRICSALELAPMDVPVSQFWDGIDGRWSTFVMRLGMGHEAQIVRLLPSNTQSMPLVVLPTGCKPEWDLKHCAEERGGYHLTNSSATWTPAGIFDLNTLQEKFLGFQGKGQFGTEVVALGWLGSDAPAVHNQLIAGIATLDFYIGALPLNPQSVNLITRGPGQEEASRRSHQSLISNLKDQGRVPSLSWAYTAGRRNYNVPTMGSLTLGGYDTNRFEPNSLDFKMASYLSGELSFFIQNGTVAGKLLLSGPIFTFIDLSVAQLWLPIEACQVFENAFNLTWNASNNVYLASETLHDTLWHENPSITFQISPERYGDHVDISLSYTDLSMNDTKTTPTFLLKRANSTSQFTLGRAFLQSTYVIANYEYHNFSVSQAKFSNSSASPNLISIPAKNQPIPQTLSISHEGRNIGIVAGVLTAVILTAFAIWLRWGRKRRVSDRASSNSSNAIDHKAELPWMNTVKKLLGLGVVHELQGVPNYELPSGEAAAETDGKAIPPELEAVTRSELPSREVAATELECEETMRALMEKKRPTFTP